MIEKFKNLAKKKKCIMQLVDTLLKPSSKSSSWRERPALGQMTLEDPELDKRYACSTKT